MPKFILFGLMAFIPILGAIFLFQQSQPILATLSLVGSFYFVYKLLLGYTVWRFSYIKVNDDDIEHFSSSSVFKETVTVINFSDISNISFEKKGALSSLSGSGIIVLQTTSGEFRFHNAKDVESAYAKLKDAKAKASKHSPVQQEDELEAEVSELEPQPKEEDVKNSSDEDIEVIHED